MPELDSLKGKFGTRGTVAGVAYDPERKSVIAVLDNGRVFWLNEWAESEMEWDEEAPVPGTEAAEYHAEVGS